MSDSDLAEGLHCHVYSVRKQLLEGDRGLAVINQDIENDTETQNVNEPMT